MVSALTIVIESFGTGIFMGVDFSGDVRGVDWAEPEKEVSVVEDSWLCLLNLLATSPSNIHLPIYGEGEA